MNDMAIADQLQDSWNALCERAGLTGLQSCGLDLLNRYAEPHRAYHTVEHLWHVTRLLAELGGDDRLLLAAWFHDAIYDPARHDNEARSAALARLALQSGGYSEANIGFVHDAIIATASHASDSAAFDALLDADLSILGAAAPAYAAYCAGIRHEYRAVPDDAFLAGRRGFVESMLTRPFIYRTPEGRRRFEDDARRNLQTELASLRLSA